MNTYFAFEENGGFRVIDHDRRIAIYAYPTSPNAEAAKTKPASTACRMLKEWWTGCSDALREDQYVRAVESTGDLRWQPFAKLS